MKPSENLPQAFEWRGTRWQRGVGTSYFPAEGEAHVGLRQRRDCNCWYEDSDNTWRASLTPTPDCVARRSSPATPGRTPQEALDGEVVMWLMATITLPGALDLLAQLGFLAAPPAQNTVAYTYRGQMSHGNRRGKYVVELGRDIYHGLVLTGDCEITFAGGDDGLIYRLGVTQDATGGRQATFSNLNTKDGKPVIVSKAAIDTTWVGVSRAAGGFYLEDTMISGAPDPVLVGSPSTKPVRVPGR